MFHFYREKKNNNLQLEKWMEQMTAFKIDILCRFFRCYMYYVYLKQIQMRNTRHWTVLNLTNPTHSV